MANRYKWNAAIAIEKLYGKASDTGHLFGNLNVFIMV